MTEALKSLLLTLLLLGLMVAVLLTFQPYTASGGPFSKPAQRYIRAALRGDSAQLATLSVTTQPVAWALNASRGHRESLAFWSGSNDMRTGVRLGDTTEIFLYPSGPECSQAPIVLHFLGAPGDAKVVSAHSPCIAAGGP
jgi:hypothetical protein